MRSIAAHALAAVVSLLFCSPVWCADPPKIPPEIAKALVAEASSVARLTAEGKLLYEASQQKLTWGQYCGNAMRLNDEGELRRAIWNASQALFLGGGGSEPNAVAFAKRDLAVSYLYAGNLEVSERFAQESLAINLLNMNNSWNVRSVSFKTLGDIAARRGQFKIALEHYQNAVDNSSGAWKRLVIASMANAHLGAGNLAAATRLLDDIAGSVSSPVKEVVLRARGNVALKAQKHDEALAHFGALAASVDEQDGAYHRVWGFYGQARANLALGKKSEASAALVSAVEAAAKVRARFRSEEFKTGAFGELQEVFSAAVRIFAENGDAERSLAISEAGRARALLDLVRGRVKQSSGATAFSDPLGQPATLAELREYLQPNDAVIQYHVAGERSVAWVIRQKTIEVFVLPLTRAQLRNAVADLRDRITRFDPDIHEHARGLYDHLLRPLGLKGDERLVVIPHDELHLIPFQMLHDGTNYLIERVAVSTAPSASVLVGIMKRRASSTPPQLIAFGNPDLGSPELGLPGAEREVKKLERVFAGAKVYVGAEATKGRFLTESPQFSMVHVAAHTVFDDVDPLYSRIRLAAEDGSRGSVMAHEVYRLNLSRASLVTLSSCESGVARVTRGDEVWGFPRSFLSAGASSLVMSLWPVADESTELLMTNFYQSLGKKESRDALRDAQLQLIKNPKFVHPYFWSAFTLTGDWR